MIGLNFRSLTFMLFIFCLISSFHIRTCSARRGKHWRQRRGSSASLYNRNAKNHGSSNHQSTVDKMTSPQTPKLKAPSLLKATPPPSYPNTWSPPPTPPPPPPSPPPLLSPNAQPPYPNEPTPPQSPNAPSHPSYANTPPPPPSPNTPLPPPSLNSLPSPPYPNTPLPPLSLNTPLPPVLNSSPSPPYPNTPPPLQTPNAPLRWNAPPPPSYPNTPPPPQPPYPNAPLPIPYSNAPPPPPSPPPSSTAPLPRSYLNTPPPPPSPNAPTPPPPPNAPTPPPPSPNAPQPPPSLNAPPPPSYPNTPPPFPSPNAPQPPPSPNAPPPPPYPNTPSAPPPPSLNAPPPPPYPNTPSAPPPPSPNAPPPSSYLNTPPPPPPPPSPNAPQPPPPPNAPPPPPPPSPKPQSPPPPPSPPPPTSVKPPPLSKPLPIKAPRPPSPKAPPPSPKPPPPPKALPPSPKAPKPPVPQPSVVFDVLKFGARGDGASDDTKAFQSAWAAACKVEVSTIIIPSEFTFLVGPISFAGSNCQPNIVFQLDGTIIAPTSSKPWGSGLLQWIEFTKLKGITVQGSGTIDGRGSVWWKESPYAAPTEEESRLVVPLNKVEENPPISNSLGGKMPSTKPTALRFYGSSNVIVKGITIQNSPLCHLKFDNCLGVSVFNISISSPGDSPNTDGIHLQNSQNVLIRSTNLACGDDCVSIQTGCSNVYIHNVNCGPGHGISIGGLGKDQTKACVSNITVRDTNMHNTLTGVRIKTWQGGSGSVQGVLFSNIQVTEVETPIVIDQYYCHSSKCKNQTSAVALSDITYEKISGTYTVQPAYLACSDSIPCVDVILSDIDLNPLQEKYRDDAFCWNTFGESKAPVEPPIHCIQHRKQSRNWIQKDQYSCQA